jgi:hypothetical protein
VVSTFPAQRTFAEKLFANFPGGAIAAFSPPLLPIPSPKEGDKAQGESPHHDSRLSHRNKAEPEPLQDRISFDESRDKVLIVGVIRGNDNVKARSSMREAAQVSESSFYGAANCALEARSTHIILEVR